MQVRYFAFTVLPANNDATGMRCSRTDSKGKQVGVKETKCYKTKDLSKRRGVKPKERKEEKQKGEK